VRLDISVEGTAGAQARGRALERYPGVEEDFDTREGEEEAGRTGRCVCSACLLLCRVTLYHSCHFDAVCLAYCRLTVFRAELLQNEKFPISYKKWFGID